MQLDEIQEGMRVLFIPRHARGNRQHRDCVRGVVTGKTDTWVFVRYDTDRHSNATAPAYLVRDEYRGPAGVALHPRPGVRLPEELGEAPPLPSRQRRRPTEAR